MTDRAGARAYSRQSWARIAGFSLLAIIVAGLASLALQANGGSGTDIRPIIGHETRFRVGLACEFTMLNFDVVLAVALYGLLATIDRPLALLGTLWRFANAVVLSVGIVAAITALDVRSTSPAAGFLQMHIDATSIGIFIWSMGAIVHARLLWVSECIPRVLSGAYVAVAAIIFLGCLAILIVPSIDRAIDPWFVIPDLPVELAVGLWLAFRGATIESKTWQNTRAGNNVRFRNSETANGVSRGLSRPVLRV